MHCSFAAWVTLSCSDTQQIMGLVVICLYLLIVGFFLFELKPTKQEKLQQKKQKELQKLLATQQCKSCCKKHPN